MPEAGACEDITPSLLKLEMDLEDSGMFFFSSYNKITFCAFFLTFSLLGGAGGS